ncbi:MAG: hypothetical protein LUG85_02955 [Clostridiales bacterium]|nr:hypothetical protein [Clostridiales bacterium]
MAESKYEELREKYPEFIYKSYSLQYREGEILISYSFEIPGLASFNPSTKISTENLKLVNGFNSETGRKIIFYLGMVEAVSYLKCACCPVMRVECGYLSEKEKSWWKKLYFGGLGEFFYRNGINADFETFLTIEAEGVKIDAKGEEINISERALVPIGGGKDSAVTAELVKKCCGDILFFTVNSQQARTDTVLAAGFGEDSIVKTQRTIDSRLLELNKQGFLNGHTPFSAIVAFLSLYCGYITGSAYIVLSNESSANESNIKGLSVNHQYSKSYEFERDFSEYVRENILEGIDYFSILRPFNELQIAKEFCSYPKYLHKFRSCNAGSKENKWCCNCPKCLFVFGILSAFTDTEELTEVFGENLFEKEEMLEDFRGLVGLSPVKPFECVGTAEEIRFALSAAIAKYRQRGKELPPLLREFEENFNTEEILKSPVLSEFNNEHGIPEKFMPAVKEMYGYVSGKSD